MQVVRWTVSTSAGPRKSDRNRARTCRSVRAFCVSDGLLPHVVAARAVENGWTFGRGTACPCLSFMSFSVRNRVGIEPVSDSPLPGLPWAWVGFRPPAARVSCFDRELDLDAAAGPLVNRSPQCVPLEVSFQRQHRTSRGINPPGNPCELFRPPPLQLGRNVGKASPDTPPRNQLRPDVAGRHRPPASSQPAARFADVFQPRRFPFNRFQSFAHDAAPTSCCCRASFNARFRAVTRDHGRPSRLVKPSAFSLAASSAPVALW